MGNKPIIKAIGIVDVDFGKNVVVIEPVNMYGCKLADDCFVGPFVEIQHNVKIGERTRIQSHCFICELVTIGADCFIGHGVMFINDLMKSGKIAKSSKFFKKTKIGNNVIIGSNATILPVNIADNIVVGAGSVVTKNLNIQGIYAGNPAKLVRKI